MSRNVHSKNTHRSVKETPDAENTLKNTARDNNSKSHRKTNKKLLQEPS
jgi:hypothetical protein